MPSHDTPPVQKAPHRTGRPHAWFVPLTFCVLAIALALAPRSVTGPPPEPVPVPARFTDTTPVRTPSMKPEIRIGQYEYRCSECHDLFPSPKETFRPLTQHQHIRLRHGINTRCFNCHHATNRNAFADDFGQPIPFDQPQKLCAKCHGPVYRDWLNGSHGRTNGYWDTSRGRRVRRKCIECHDPHDPAFDPLEPAPPPSTWRLPGHATEDVEHESDTEGAAPRDPLSIYRQDHTHGSGTGHDNAQPAADERRSSRETDE